ncbi:MAG: hypothetical protein IT410_02475 [Candidatus Doudnabacteria bacterium]|nr:hypothetical protein [Candidatus Doudnabacteria bacterium]
MTNLKRIGTGLIAFIVAFSLPSLAFAAITVGSTSLTTTSTLSLQGGNVGIGTSVPGKVLEINSATGANLRLTYNDSDGSAANYGDLSVTSSGDVTLAPSGGDLNVTGNGIYSGLLAVGGSSIDSTVYLNLLNTGAYGGDGVTRYGYSADLTATDLSNVTAGYFSAGSSYGVSGADHNVLTGLDVHTNFTGAGRVDNSQGIYIQVANSSTGNMKDAYGIYNQILGYNVAGTSGPTTNAILYYGDLVNTSSSNSYQSASIFHGKIRTLGGTSGYGTAYGLNLSGWSTPGATVTTSYGIYMDNSIDIGTTKYALYSDSNSNSYIKTNLGLGTNLPTEQLDINSNNIRIRTAKTPATAAEACNQGEISWDASYMYICIADNSWHRSAHATW